jgi:transcriptional regulator with GAF, ATPase, and Fis domain
VSGRLVVVVGPLKDTEFQLDEAEVTIGRDAGNRLAISDPSLSRHHCVVIREGNRFKVKDLESRNGSFVNGVAVKEAWLEHGDQLAVGDSVLTYVSEEPTQPHVASNVEFADGMTQAMARLHPQDVLYLQPERVLQEMPSMPNLARNLSALLKISGVVHAVRGLEALQEKILELIFETIPAERAVVLLDSRGKGEFGSTFALHRHGRQASPIQVSRTILRQAVEQGVAILGADVPHSGTLSEVESVVAASVGSLMCVPLTVFAGVIGCIYLDTTSAARFDEGHLQLLAAIAGISAIALANARRLEWLEEENLRLTAEINLEHDMIGASARMKEVYQFLSRVAPSDSTVLIEGESGTGKEVMARALHRNSPRSKRPFVAINCAAIPEGLLESELFGYEKGAFTGAATQKKGKLELADGGVAFLDEVGELAPSLQVKLLRVLQEREFERVGGTRPISVDIRLIAATNRDLREAVKDGEFRQDLYYRLNVVSVVMPPLRERWEDIPLLAEYFGTKYAKKSNLNPKPISAEAMACLMDYDWPGNVRELENAIERAMVLSTSETVRPEDLPDSVLEREFQPGAPAAKYQTAVKELKKQLILNAVKDAHGAYTEAARILGVHPNYLHRLIRNLGLKDAVQVAPRAPTTRLPLNRN